MDITFFRFDVCGEMDHRRYELTIGVSEKPAVLEQTGSIDGYYLDQVEFYLFEPEGDNDDSGYSIMITLHQSINPGYDRAVEQLVGHKLATIIQDSGGTEAEHLERDTIMSSRGDQPIEAVLQKFLDQGIDKARASQILNRILVNSTFP